MKSVAISALLSAAFLQGAIAHPGHDVSEEVAQRAAYMGNPHNKRSLAHCAEKLKARGNEAAMVARRKAIAENLRKKRGISHENNYLKARDLNSTLNTDHHSNLTGITPDTDPSILFTGNSSCVLTPETTQGPYWVEGELVRKDNTDGQAGVALTLDIQIIDVNTCNPVPNAYLEMWHCNSTGVYSGVSANGNGNSANDTSNLNATFLRGIQQADSDGVVAFDTIFPGHYTGRATHTHVLAHINATLLPNNTLSGGSISHVGQMFFDQSLISQVEETAPYNTNTQELTENADDSILSGEAEDVDPFMEYVFLGDSISDGIFGWLAFGLDATAAYNVTPAVYWTENGGVANPNSGGGGGPGGPPPSGSGRPSGTALPTSSAA